MLRWSYNRAVAQAPPAPPDDTQDVNAQPEGITVAGAPAPASPNTYEFVVGGVSHKAQFDKAPSQQDLDELATQMKWPNPKTYNLTINGQRHAFQFDKDPSQQDLREVSAQFQRLAPPTPQVGQGADADSDYKTYLNAIAPIAQGGRGLDPIRAGIAYRSKASLGSVLGGNLVSTPSGDPYEGLPSLDSPAAINPQRVPTLVRQPGSKAPQGHPAININGQIVQQGSQSSGSSPAKPHVAASAGQMSQSDMGFAIGQGQTVPDSQRAAQGNFSPEPPFTANEWWDAGKQLLGMGANDSVQQVHQAAQTLAQGIGKALPSGLIKPSTAQALQSSPDPSMRRTFYALQTLDPTNIPAFVSQLTGNGGPSKLSDDLQDLVRRAGKGDQQAQDQLIGTIYGTITGIGLHAALPYVADLQSFGAGGRPLPGSYPAPHPNDVVLPRPVDDLTRNAAIQTLREEGVLAPAPSGPAGTPAENLQQPGVVRHGTGGIPIPPDRAPAIVDRAIGWLQAQNQPVSQGTIQATIRNMREELLARRAATEASGGKYVAEPNSAESPPSASAAVQPAATKPVNDLIQSGSDSSVAPNAPPSQPAASAPASPVPAQEQTSAPLLRPLPVASSRPAGSFPDQASAIASFNAGAIPEGSTILVAGAPFSIGAQSSSSAHPSMPPPAQAPRASTQDIAADAIVKRFRLGGDPAEPGSPLQIFAQSNGLHVVDPRQLGPYHQPNYPVDVQGHTGPTDTPAAWDKVISPIITDLQGNIVRNGIATTVGVQTNRPELQGISLGGVTAQHPEGGHWHQLENMVVPLDSLLASHDPGSFQAHPNYPPELQPRDRSREQLRAQVWRNAGSLNTGNEITHNYGLTSQGAPIVSADGTVEAGNGRAMSMRLARDQHNRAWKAYQDHIRQIAPGSDSMKDPVLVRVRREPMTMGERVDFAGRANGAGVAASSSVEQASQAASVLSPNVINNLVDVGTSLRDALASPSNSAAMDRFLMSLPDNERAGIGGDRIKTLTALEHAVLGRLLGPNQNDILDRIIAQGDVGARIVGGIKRAAIPLLKALAATEQPHTGVSPLLDFRSTLGEALTLSQEYAEAPNKGNWLAQGRLIEPDPSAWRLFEGLINSRSQIQVSDYLEGIANRILGAGDGGMFDDGPAVPQTIPELFAAMDSESRIATAQDLGLSPDEIQVVVDDHISPPDETADRSGAQMLAGEAASATPEQLADVQSEFGLTPDELTTAIDDATRGDLSESQEPGSPTVGGTTAGGVQQGQGASPVSGSGPSADAGFLSRRADELGDASGGSAWQQRDLAGRTDILDAVVAGVEQRVPLSGSAIENIVDTLIASTGVPPIESDPNVIALGNWQIDVQPGGVSISMVPLISPPDNWFGSEDDFERMMDRAEGQSVHADVLTPSQPTLLDEPQSDLELSSPEAQPAKRTATSGAFQNAFDLNESPSLFDDGQASVDPGVPEGASAGLVELRKLFGGPGGGVAEPVARLSSDVDANLYRQALPHFTDSLKAFLAAGRTSQDYVQHIFDTMGPAIRPYLRQFRADVQSGKVDLNAPNSDQLLERPGGAQPASQQNMAPDHAEPVPGGDGQPTDVSRAESQTPRGQGPDNQGVPGGSASPGRTPGDLFVRPGEPEPFASEDLPRGELGSGGSPARGPRDDVNPGRKEGFDEAPGGLFGKPERLDKAIVDQAAAVGSRIVLGDAANIKETLPLLQEGQLDDVKFAEDRLAKADGHGVLFTNGTGTGKTYTGLGIAYRQWAAGKRNILIVTPSDNICRDWVATASRFTMPVKVLSGTGDNGGSGPVTTTFANFGVNDSLSKRDWDLILVDEAHKLSQNADGDSTDALKMLRALTKHPQGYMRLASARNPEAYADLREASKAMDDAHEQRDYAAIGRANQRQAAAFQKIREIERATHDEVSQVKPQDRPRATFLSATPWAYPKNIDWANGFLFDYGPESRNVGAYNAPSPQSAFMVQHFGYRMRYGKLTAPDASVDSGLMERNFNAHLRRKGSLSYRQVDLPHDYDRLFELAPSKIGNRIDEAIKWLSDHEHQERRVISDAIAKNFTYLKRKYLLEAIKAHEAVPYIAEHLNAGRKVVVFHDLNKPNDLGNPFTLKTGSNPAYEEFKRSFPDLVGFPFDEMPGPIETFREHFPSFLQYDGTIPKAQRVRNRDLFNSDDPRHNLILVQADAGKEGLSLHDTTGGYERVLVNLGMPTAPTTAIQQEGRIRRIGQASNSMFRYLTTGTDWERWAFANTIARRSSTAENLGAGESARALFDAFVDAYTSAAHYGVGFAGEGTGGKVGDRAISMAISDWDRAVAAYNGNLQRTSKTKSAEGTDYFATPEPIGLKLVQWALSGGVRFSESMLEPSAGHGAIARSFPDNVDRTAIEPSSELASNLALRFDGKIVTAPFEDYHIVNKHSSVVMNPPFGHGGSTAIAHVAKAFGHLSEGGRIVAIIPRGPSADAKFENLLHGVDTKGKSLRSDMALTASIDLPSVTFNRAGTSVMTRVVILDKIAPEKAPQAVYRDLSDAGTMQELFDRIRDMDVPARARVEQAAPVTTQSAAGGRWAGGNAPESGAQKATTTVPSKNNSYDSFEQDHTRTGEKLYMAASKNRTTREEYDRVLAIAKDAGGYYSAYRGAGAKTGFVFKSADDRDGFLSKVSGGSSGSAAKSSGSFEAFDQQRGKGSYASTEYMAALPSGKRIDTDTYTRFDPLAKAAGGVFLPSDGPNSRPGFSFKSADARDRFVSATNPDSVAEPAVRYKGGNANQGHLFDFDQPRLFDDELGRDSHYSPSTEAGGIRAGTTPAQLEARATGIREFNRAAPIVRHSAYVKDLVQHGGVEILGTQVGTPADLAGAAMILRSPYVETVRWFFLRGGIIIAHTAVSSRLAAASAIWPDRGDISLTGLKRIADACGADSIYMMHNHPSGDPSPSYEDRLATSQVHIALGSRFKGHVVINHNRFAFLPPQGGGKEGPSKVQRLPLPTGLDPTRASIAPSILGAEPKSVSDIARLSKDVEQSPGYAMLIGHDAKGKIVTLADYPVTGITQIGRAESLRAAAVLRRLSRNTGTSMWVAALGPQHTELLKAPGVMDALRNAIGSDLLAEVVLPNGLYLGSQMAADGVHAKLLNSTNLNQRIRRGYSVAESPLETYASRFKTNPEGGREIHSVGAELRNATVENLSGAKAIDPHIVTLATRLTASRAEASIIMRQTMSRIAKAVGDSAYPERFRQMLVTGRLIGAAMRNQQIADDVAAMAPAVFGHEYESSLRTIADAGGIASKIDKILAGGGSPLMGTSALSDAQNEFVSYMQSAAAAAASNAHAMIPPQEFWGEEQTPEFQQALQIYKEHAEQLAAESHASNEGVFSTALGPLDTYYPLTPLDDAGKATQKGKTFMGAELGKPMNIRNSFTLGNNPHGYDTGMHAAVESLYRSSRVNNKAKLIQYMEDQGYIRVLTPKQIDALSAYPTVGIGTQSYAAHLVKLTPDRMIAGVLVPGRQALIPDFLGKELLPVLGRQSELGSSGPQRRKLDEEQIKAEMGRQGFPMSALSSYAVAGPLDAYFHSRNAISALVSGTPFLGSSAIGRTVGTMPYMKRLYAMYQVLVQMPATGYASTPEGMQIIERLMQAGAIPNRYASETLSPETAKATGAELKAWQVGSVSIPKGFGAAIYGPHGIDINTRVLFYKALTAAFPDRDLTDSEIRDYVNQMGAYNRALEPAIVRFAKQSHLGIFATAGSTRIRNQFRSATGGTMSPPSAPTGKRLRVWLRQHLSQGIVAYLTTWAVLNKLLDKDHRWPWEAGIKLGKIPIPDDWRTSVAGRRLWGPGNSKQETDVAFAFPSVAGGLRLTGARSLYDVGAAEHGSANEVSDAMKRDIFNANVGPYISSPYAKGAFIGLTGHDPFIRALRDRQGSSNPQFFEVSPPRSSPFSQMLENVKQGAARTNMAVGNGLEATGLLHKPYWQEHESQVPTEQKIYQSIIGFIFDQAIDEVHENPRQTQQLGQEERGIQKQAGKQDQYEKTGKAPVSGGRGTGLGSFLGTGRGSEFGGGDTGIE